jgi:putative ABC transport system permease protein
MPTQVDPAQVGRIVLGAFLVVLELLLALLVAYIFLTRAGREALRMGLASLRRSPLRTLLTMLGIVIGVAAVVAVISMGDGARQMVVDEVARTGGVTTIEVYRDEWDRQGGSTITSRARSRRWGRWGRNRAKPLEYRDYLNLRMFLTRASAVSAEEDFSRGVLVQYGTLEKETAVIGATPDYVNTYTWPIGSGRFLTDGDLDEAAQVVVLGSVLVKELFGQRDPVGEEVRIRRPPPPGGGFGERRRGWGGFDIRLRVVGVMSEKGDTTATQGWDERVIMPLTAFHSRVVGNDTLERVRIKAASPDDVAATIGEVKSLLGRRHTDADAFKYWTAEEEIRTAARLGTILKLLMGVIAGIALIVAGIGIMNIMLVSVAERTREIGLRKALGAKRRDVLFQFLIETSVLSLAGGLLGATVGVVLGKSSARLLERFVLSGSQWPSVVSPLAVVIAIGVALMVGVISGVYPARRAALLTPVEALRAD